MPAQGEVWFAIDGPGPLEIHGQMVDSSKSGFRASHSHPELSAGQKVRFRNSLSEGGAVVMWNRVLANHVETGFLIVGKYVGRTHIPLYHFRVVSQLRHYPFS